MSPSRARSGSRSPRRSPAPPAPRERRLRANRAFELVLFDRLPAAERRALAGLTRDPEHYGVLRPRRASGLGLKAVDRETALLVLTLARPGPLPAYVRDRLGEAGAAAVVARLVADGVLEIEREPGRFVSGAAAVGEGDAPAAPVAGGIGAAGWIGAAGDVARGAAGRFASSGGIAGRGLPAGGRLAELSRAALRYGQELASIEGAADPVRLSQRLYAFHGLPLTPGWRRALPGPAAVRSRLGIAEGGPLRRLLDRHWRELAAAEGEPWLRWHPAVSRSAAPADVATFKLYVSLAPAALPEGFGRVLAGLAAVGPPAFKVGATAGGLLRPDKIVAYFVSFERLAEAASALAEGLAGAAAHGVPFTSEIAGGGLLSWGVDPPLGAGLGPAWGDGRTSWRLWLTDRLARALIAGVASAAGAAGRAAAETMEPWRFAVERLRLEGIDTDSWTPGGGLWRAPAAASSRR